jgi:flagellar L-ring protein precursor FlgH
MRWVAGLCLGVLAWVSSVPAGAQQPAAGGAPAEAAPPSVRQVSLYADVKARAVGDIVTVAIVERASGSNSSRLSTSRNTQFNDDSGSGGTGLFSFVPEFGMSAEMGRDHEGSGQLSREGRLTARMAAEVTEIRPNGALVIKGEREVGVNEETEILTLTGVVRPEDIGPGNVVYSTDIAEAKIQYRGKGLVTAGSRPNLIARILSWIF